MWLARSFQPLHELVRAPTCWKADLLKMSLLQTRVLTRLGARLRSVAWFGEVELIGNE